jgi:hypothetical protein
MFQRNALSIRTMLVVGFLLAALMFLLFSADHGKRKLVLPAAIKAKADLAAIANAVAAYATDNGGRYPQSLEDLLGPALDSSSTDIDAVPRTLRGNSYLYEPPGLPSNHFRVVLTEGMAHLAAMEQRGSCQSWSP